MCVLRVESAFGVEYHIEAYKAQCFIKLTWLIALLLGRMLLR